MTYRGHVRNGIIVFDTPVTLPEGAEVRIDLLKAAAPDADTENRTTLFDSLQPLIGKAEGLPADGSTNVDHYLYGHPKQ